MEELVRAIQSNDAARVSAVAEKQKRYLNTILRLPLHNNYQNIIPGRANVHEADKYTPLTYAIIHGVSNKVLETLLAKGADSNMKDINTFPIIIAVNHKNLNYCRILLEHGANPNISSYVMDWENPYIATPLTNAVLQKNIQIIQLLLEYGAVAQEDFLDILLDRILLQDITENPNHALEVFLAAAPIFKRGYNLNQVSIFGETILHRLVRMYSYNLHTKTQIAKFLIEQGANAMIQDENGKYPYEVIQKQWDEPEEETKPLYKVLIAPFKRNIYSTLRLGTGNVFPYKFYPALNQRVQGNVIWPAEQLPNSPNETNRMPNVPSFSLFEYNMAPNANRNRTNKNRNKTNKSRKATKKTPYQQMHANQPNKPTGFLSKEIAREITNFTY